MEKKWQALEDATSRSGKKGEEGKVARNAWEKKEGGTREKKKNSTRGKVLARTQAAFIKGPIESGIDSPTKEGMARGILRLHGWR